jgi:N-sulfoglucosamine sulfohydrolase
MTRREFSLCVSAAAQAAARRPNIVWITGEDLGPQLGCYGYPLVRTPNLDLLAEQGTRFSRAFTTAPVCSPSRSAILTGRYQTTIGAHHHRSHQNDGYRLPDNARLMTHRLRDAGYFTANVGQIAPGVSGTKKVDLNFAASEVYQGSHWRERKEGQPFFAHINFAAAHKGPAFVEARKQKDLVDPNAITLPAYYADHPVIREEFANYLDAVNLLDRQVGALLETLAKDRVLDNTLVVFFGDNGRCLLRGKVYLYDAGLHVPLIVKWPGVTEAASIRNDLVSALDITATTLHAAGIDAGSQIDGRPLFASGGLKRSHVFAARDRCGEAMDRMRAVRTENYKYIRNFMPERSYTQPHKYQEEYYPTRGVMKALYEQGKLNARQAPFFAETKPPEELYDLLADPDETVNLAARPGFQAIRKQMGGLLENWIEQSKDMGRYAENPESAR